MSTTEEHVPTVMVAKEKFCDYYAAQVRGRSTFLRAWFWRYHCPACGVYIRRLANLNRGKQMVCIGTRQKAFKKGADWTLPAWGKRR